MYRSWGKRTFDCLLGGFSFLVLSPLLLVIALAILVFDTGPIIFRQERVGENGRCFSFFKFRSLPVGTENVASDELGSVSVSWFGRFIRRTNLDELPQLINVLRGDMSLVGPRPPIPTQTDLLALRRVSGALSLKPGLTGLAQVNSFDGMSTEEKARFDELYARSLSFHQDLQIIMRTFLYLLKVPPVY